MYMGSWVESVFQFAKKSNEFYLNVKFVPRLGPLAVSRASKNTTASAVELKVTDRRPPYPPLGVRQKS